MIGKRLLPLSFTDEIDEKKALFIFKEACKDYENDLKIDLLKKLDQLKYDQLLEIYNKLITDSSSNETKSTYSLDFLKDQLKVMINSHDFSNNYKNLLSIDEKQKDSVTNFLRGIQKIGLIQALQTKENSTRFFEPLNDETNQKILFARRDSKIKTFFKRIVVGLSFLATLPLYGIGGILAHELLLEQQNTAGGKFYKKIHQHREQLEKEKAFKDENFSSQCLVIRVGDNTFLRNVHDLYEGPAHQYTSEDNKRGIVSIFPSQHEFAHLIPSKIAKKQHEDFTVSGETSVILNDEKDTAKQAWIQLSQTSMYYKDKDSYEAFNTQIDDKTRLKIYLAGHCKENGTYLQSLEFTDRLFNLDYMDIANSLDAIFKKKFSDGKAKNVEISLIACMAGAGNHSFAERLLQALTDKGHDVIIKASTGIRIAPIPFMSKTREGIKKLFAKHGEDLIAVDIKNNWSYKVLQTLRGYESQYKGLDTKHKESIKNIITTIQDKESYNNETKEEALVEQLRSLNTTIFSSRKDSNSFFKRNFRSVLEKDLEKLINSYKQMKLKKQTLS